MEKQYGLIIPGKQKPKETPKPSFTRPSIFDESSEDEDNAPPQLLKMKPTPYGPSATDRKMAQKLQEKAIAEDPTVYQYDELYDEIENKRDEAKKAKSNEVKKPKYIGRLLQYAEKRKLENERRIERMVQKEREQEGEEFKDKESFVTSTYRKKLEDIQKAEAEDKREEYLESIGDVTKQKDLDGFYRHLFEQKLGTKEKPENKIEPNAAAPAVPNEEITEAAYKPIKSGKPRAYRKRRSSGEEQEEKSESQPSKRAHIQSNLDADSDFSIDSSSDEEENVKKKPKNPPQNVPVPIKEEPQEKENNTIAAEPQSTEVKDIKVEGIKKEDEIKEEKEEEEPAASKPKIDKTLIWKKRTVGDVFDAALQRYFQRKAARNG